jgi:hypothetical protein
VHVIEVAGAEHPAEGFSTVTTEYLRTGGPPMVSGAVHVTEAEPLIFGPSEATTLGAAGAEGGVTAGGEGSESVAEAVVGKNPKREPATRADSSPSRNPLAPDSVFPIT